MFTNDAKVLQQAVLYAQVLAFSQLFVAYEALAEGILSGSGKTKAIFYWSAPLNLLRIRVVGCLPSTMVTVRRRSGG